MLGPCHMKGEVLVAEPEPIVAAEPFHVLDEIPAFLRASPTPLQIAEVSERVKNGVDVGANPQAQMFEIITDVDDDRRRPGLGNPLQSQGKFRSAHAAAQRDDLFFFSWVMTPCGYRSGHRNRSWLAGRISATAGSGWVLRLSPLKITTGHPSAACPIKSDAPAAISSAMAISVTRRGRPNRSGVLTKL